jgi:outer membrane biosynthesis protein TonB
MDESAAPTPAASEAPSVVAEAEQAPPPASQPPPPPPPAAEGKEVAKEKPEEKKRSRSKDRDRDRNKEKHREKRRSRSRSREKKKHKEGRREEPPAPVKVGLPIKSASGWAVMVSGLQGSESDSSLRDRFSAYGMVGRIYVNRSLRTGLATSALVEFEVATEAEAAIASCNGRAGFAVLDNV